jgi:hypothetical protein
MGKPVGKAWACLREAASAKAGANLYTDEHMLSSHMLDFTLGDFLSFP